MARLLTNAEIFAAVDSVGVIRDTSGGVATTVATAVAAGDSLVPVAAAGALATDDICRIGNEANEEVVIIESLSTNDITTVSELAYAHAVGEDFVQQERTPIGDVSDDGFDVEFQVDRNQVNAATRRERLCFLVGNMNARLSFSLEGHSQENLLAAVGAPESGIHGAGSAADPSVADMTPDVFDTQLNQSWYFTGSLKNGTTVEVQVWRTQVDPNKTINYTRGNPALIPVAVDLGHTRYYQPAPPA